MHFERLHFNVNKQTVLDDAVGDAVYTGATVQWRGHNKHDTEWFFSQLAAVLQLWAPDRSDDEWLLVGTADAEGENVRYSLHSGGESAWRQTDDWGSLTDDQRAEILEHVQAALDSVHALLLII